MNSYRNNRNGMTLLEILVCIGIIPIILMGITSSLIMIKQLQSRTDSITRLTNAATSTIEDWKIKNFAELKPGDYEITNSVLTETDKITVTVKETENKDLREIIVKAEYKDSKYPQVLTLSTFVMK